MRLLNTVPQKILVLYSGCFFQKYLLSMCPFILEYLEKINLFHLKNIILTLNLYIDHALVLTYVFLNVKAPKKRI